MMNEQNSFPYSTLVNNYSYSSYFVQETTLEYANSTTGENATVRVRAYKHSPVLEFEVLLGGIPNTT
jgi:predicted P-loop ATPase